jgi:ADP-ribosyl-[dinitrogen reductase] hydrolase
MTSTTTARPDEQIATDARLRGAIWGRLVADAAALGSHWIYDLTVLEQRFPGGPQGFETPAADHYHAGKQTGDQTHYGDGALLLLESVAKQGRFDLPSFGTEFLTRFREGTYSGYLDHATRDTVANYDAFVATTPQTSFDFQHGADDDHPATVTRSAAVIVRHYRDRDVLASVEALTRFAQDNPRTLAYARADAVLLLALLNGATIDSALDQVVNHFVPAASNEHVAVITAIARARGDVGREPTAVTVEYGQSCPLPNTFPAAVQILLHHQADYPAAVRAALRGGGDSAGRAALVGGWLGAHLGLEAIPLLWRERLSAAAAITSATDTIVADATASATR